MTTDTTEAPDKKAKRSKLGLDEESESSEKGKVSAQAKE